MEIVDGPGIHGRLSEEGRLHRRVLQIRQRRAHVPHQPVASNASLLARPALPRRAFLLGPCPSCPQLQRCPTLISRLNPSTHSNSTLSSSRPLISWAGTGSNDLSSSPVRSRSTWLNSWRA